MLHYIGAALYELSNASNEKAETQTKACGIGTQIQQVEFVFLLKTYRKIFEHCTPIIVTMQKTTLDAIQLTSMINDFKVVLANFNFDGDWEDTLLTDPELPTVRNRGDGEQWSKEMMDHRRAGGQLLQNAAKKLLQSLQSNSIGNLQTSQNSNG